MNSTKKFISQNERGTHGYWLIPFVEKGEDPSSLSYFIKMLGITNLKKAVERTKKHCKVEIMIEEIEKPKCPLRAVKIWISAA